MSSATFDHLWLSKLSIAVLQTTSATFDYEQAKLSIDVQTACSIDSNFPQNKPFKEQSRICQRKENKSLEHLIARGSCITSIHRL